MYMGERTPPGGAEFILMPWAACSILLSRSMFGIYDRRDQLEMSEKNLSEVP